MKIYPIPFLIALRQRELFTPLLRDNEALKQLQLKKLLAVLICNEMNLTNFYKKMANDIIKFGDFSKLIALIIFAEEKIKPTLAETLLADAIFECIESLKSVYFKRCSLTSNDLKIIVNFCENPFKFGFYPQVELLYNLLEKIIYANNHLKITSLSLKMKFLTQLSHYTIFDLRKIMNTLTLGIRHNGSINIPECLRYFHDLINYGCHAAVEIRKPILFLFGLARDTNAVRATENARASNARIRSKHMRIDVMTALISHGDPESLFHKSIAIISNHFCNDATRLHLIHDSKLAYLISHFTEESLEEGFNSLLLAEKLQFEPACDYARLLRSGKIELDNWVEENHVRITLKN